MTWPVGGVVHQSDALDPVFCRHCTSQNAASDCGHAQGDFGRGEKFFHHTSFLKSGVIIYPFKLIFRFSLKFSYENAIWCDFDLCCVCAWVAPRTELYC